MTKDYRDVTSVETEDEGDLPVRTDFAPRQSWGRRICSGRRLILVLLGLLCTLVITMVAFGFSGRKFDADLSEMQENLKSINRTVFLELAALKEKEANEGKVFTKMNAMAKNLTEEVKEAKTHFEDHISKLQTAFLKLNCELEDTKHNRSGSRSAKTVCCPREWFSFRQHCYWFSKTEKNWEEAKADCENKDAHLAIITSYLEQNFVAQHTKPRNFWIGLFYTKQSWKWVDGTAYTMRRIDWRPHELLMYPSYPKREDCAHLYRDGLWSSQSCLFRLNWVCEMEAKG